MGFAIIGKPYKKWKPKATQRYWYVEIRDGSNEPSFTGCFKVKCRRNISLFDAGAFNCFRTRKEAVEARRMIIECLK